MATPPKDDDKLPDDEAEARFKRVVGNLVNTPHTPHKVPIHDDTTRKKPGN